MIDPITPSQSFAQQQDFEADFTVSFEPQNVREPTEKRLTLSWKSLCVTPTILNLDRSHISAQDTMLISQLSQSIGEIISS